MAHNAKSYNICIFLMECVHFRYNCNEDITLESNMGQSILENLSHGSYCELFRERPFDFIGEGG